MCMCVRACVRGAGGGGGGSGVVVVVVVARTRRRASWPCGALRGASGRRRWEDKIRVMAAPRITTLEFPVSKTWKSRCKWMNSFSSQFMID